ncbi:MAG TPA: DUF4097 family beta strand repeat-containing protein [Terriglobales bacterium]|nr:DUF4097 family beta strand repeat-containing protein [Terriglobales bacterium]
MKRKIAVLATLALLALPLSARADQAEGSFQRTLKVASGDVEVSVKTGSGNIDVRTGSGDTVEIRARIRARSGWGLSAEEKVKRLEANPPIEQTGNSIRIGRIEDRELRNNVSIDYDLVVPARTRVGSATGSGDLKVRGLQGALKASTGSGNLSLSNITADVRAESGSGDMELQDVKGSMYVSTGSGNIRTARVAGRFIGSTGSGDIHLDQTSSGEVKVETGSGNVIANGVDGALSVATGSGDVEINGRQAGEWRMSTGSGNVRVRFAGEPSFELDAETSSGSIDVDHPITIQGRFQKHALHGKVRNGGNLVYVRTGSGDIEFR